MITVLRVVIMYLTMLVGLRLLGKREFGQLSPFELVALLLIPELSSQAIVGQDYSLTGAIVSIATLLALMYLVSVAAHFSNTFSKVVGGEPIIVVYNGKLVEDAINLERVEVEEIYTEMHKVGLERLEQVKWAILENDGSIAIIPNESRYLVNSESTKRLT
jgi:uncharacterized membrane protein YcaP (DUF421 family)